MKSIYPALFVLSVLSVLGKPGETYLLTGDEKSISGIIKADAEKYPDLYKEVSLKNYRAEFEKINQIGRRKLTPGDTLIFPKTPASQKAEDEKNAEQARAEEKKKNARRDGIYYYQHRFLPGMTHRTGERFFSDLESGIFSPLIKRAHALVDSDFAKALIVKSYPEKKLYVLVFELPTQSSHCYYAAIKEEEMGYSYYTLEKGINLFGAGDISVLCMWENDGTHVKLGGRKYDDLESFLKEFE